MSFERPEAGGPDADAERRRAVAAATARSHELELEQSVLAEIVAQLAADERSLAADLGAARRECAELEQQLAQKQARLAGLDSEIDAAEDQSAALEIERDVLGRRNDRAAELARELERALASYRSQIAQARSCFQEALRDMARIKHKLNQAASVASDVLERTK